MIKKFDEYVNEGINLHKTIKKLKNIFSVSKNNILDGFQYSNLDKCGDNLKSIVEKILKNPYRFSNNEVINVEVRMNDDIATLISDDMNAEFWGAIDDNYRRPYNLNGENGTTYDIIISIYEKEKLNVILTWTDDKYGEMEAIPDSKYLEIDDLYKDINDNL